MFEIDKENEKYAMSATFLDGSYFAFHNAWEELKNYFKMAMTNELQDKWNELDKTKKLSFKTLTLKYVENKCTNEVIEESSALASYVDL